MINAYVVVKDDAVGAIEWSISVNSTSVWAHQHAAGARKRGAAVHPSLATRSSERAAYYRATLQLISTVLWLR